MFIQRLDMEQYGGVLPVFMGTRRQYRGSVMGSAVKMIAPVIKRILPQVIKKGMPFLRKVVGTPIAHSLGRQVMRFGLDVISDLSQGGNVKKVLKQHASVHAKRQ